MKVCVIFPEIPYSLGLVSYILKNSGDERHPSSYVRDGAAVIHNADELLEKLESNTILTDKKKYKNEQPVLWNKTE